MVNIINIVNNRGLLTFHCYITEPQPGCSVLLLFFQENTLLLVY